MMRFLLLSLLLVAFLGAFTIVNNCNAPQDYVDALNNYLQQAYDTYSKEIKTPALCPNFYVELRNDIQYPAATYSQIGPVGVCAYKMVFRCDNSKTWLQHLAYHEMTHALQDAVGDGGKGYGWWSEAHAEGLASYYMVVRIYQIGQWQKYGWIQDFWDKQLYKQDPWQCTAPNLCSYEYGAFFAWLAWRYSPLNSTLTYSLPNNELRQAYWNFLLSPWSWGRDPTYLDFDNCRDAVNPDSALYCIYSPVLPNRIYVFSSSLLINTTGLPDKILLALVATKSSTADPSVTVSYCPECSSTSTVTTTVTTTQTVTSTQTVTETETYTVTYTATVTVPTTYTTTITATQTVTQTETSTATYTVTVPMTVTTTSTVTTTLPVTYTDTVTKTDTATVTVPITSTVTSTRTYTTTVTNTTTVTTTVPGQESGNCTWYFYATIALVILIVLCLARCRNTAVNKRKRFNRYGSAVYT